jgi:hypothetical protein
MWGAVARRYRWTDRIAGYEIMSEPRTKVINQAAVRDFMRGGCEAVHTEDAGALCVVGPRPYYKLWELNDDVLQPAGSNTLYTFDFFVPKAFVESDTAKGIAEDCSHGEGCRGPWFPGDYRCKDVYDTWWRGKPGCHGSESKIHIDAAWIKETLQKHAVGFAQRHNVPVHCNQWGVKDEVFEANGRVRYAQAVRRLPTHTDAQRRARALRSRDAALGARAQTRAFGLRSHHARWPSVVADARQLHRVQHLFDLLDLEVVHQGRPRRERAGLGLRARAQRRAARSARCHDALGSAVWLPEDGAGQPREPRALRRERLAWHNAR